MACPGEGIPRRVRAYSLWPKVAWGLRQSPRIHACLRNQYATQLLELKMVLQLPSSKTSSNDDPTNSTAVVRTLENPLASSKLLPHHAHNREHRQAAIVEFLVLHF